MLALICVLKSICNIEESILLLSETSSKETDREVGPAHLLCIEGAPSPIYRGNLGQSAISPPAGCTTNHLAFKNPKNLHLCS